MTDVSDFLNSSSSVGSQNFNTLRSELNKRQPFCKRHFNCPFFSAFFLQTPLMSVSRGPIDTKVAISVGNVLGSYRKQAITCTNYGLFYWCTYTSLGLDELTTAFIDAEPWKRIFFFHLWLPVWTITFSVHDTRLHNSTDEKAASVCF